MARAVQAAWMARGKTLAILAAWLTALVSKSEATYRLLSLPELCRRQPNQKPVKIEMEEGGSAVLVLYQGEVSKPYWRCDLEISAGKGQGLMVQVMQRTKSNGKQLSRWKMPGCVPMKFAPGSATIICNWGGMITPRSSPGTRLTNSVGRRLEIWPLTCLMDRSVKKQSTEA